MQKFIEVMKVTVSQKKDSEGNLFRGPDGEPVREEPRTLREVIELGEIKSMRIWHKTDYEKTRFPSGDLIILYMKSNRVPDRQSRTPEIKIYEHFNKFAERAGIITLPS